MAIPVNILFATFATTIVIEALVVATLLNRWQQGVFFVLFVAVIVHMVTHPIGAIVFYIFNFPLLLVEVMVVLLEAVLYWKIFSISISRALIISSIANLASFLLGPIVRAVLHGFVF